MATAGGLEIHMQIAHAQEPVASVPMPVAAAPAAAVPVSPAAVSIPGVGLERPRRSAGTRTTSLTAAPLIAAAIVALLVAGVATALVRRNGPSTLAMVQAAATTTADAKTAQVSVTLKTDSGPFANGLTVGGGYDFANRRARLDIDPAQFGVTGVGKIQGIADYSNGVIVYMKFPPQISQELGGTPWVKLDVAALLRQQGIDVDLQSLISGQSNDPTQGLGMVRGAENVVKVAPEQIRGTDTTHYRLDINLQKAAAEAPTAEARAAMEKLASLHTGPSTPLDVWLDGDGRVRRIQEVLDPAAVRYPPKIQAAVAQFGRMTISYDLYDFGSFVDVQIPPADQVTDLNQVIKQGG
jgi:hypothetical protein